MLLDSSRRAFNYAVEQYLSLTVVSRKACRHQRLNSSQSVGFLARLFVNKKEGGKGWQSKQAICKSEKFPIPFRVSHLSPFTVFQSALLRPDHPYRLQKTIGILASANLELIG